MPTQTYIPLASKTLTSSASSVTFSSIVGTYRDLVVVVEAKAAVDSINLTLRLNGATTNYSGYVAYGDGSATGSFGANTTSLDLAAGSGYTTTSIRAVATVLDYSATNKHKTVLSRGDESAYTSMVIGRYASTSAITSLTVRTTTANQYAIGSTFTLYGIAG